jgi:hypothetical protein
LAEVQIPQIAVDELKVPVPLDIFQAAPVGPNVAKSFICAVVLPTGTGVPLPLLLEYL